MVAINQSIKWTSIRAWFDLWKHPLDRWPLQTLAEFKSHQLKILPGAWRELHSTRQALDRSLKSDKTQTLFLEVADQAQHQPGHEVFRVLRQAGIGGRSRRSPIQPLNFMVFEEGTPQTMDD